MDGILVLRLLLKTLSPKEGIPFDEEPSMGKNSLVEHFGCYGMVFGHRKSITEWPIPKMNMPSLGYLTPEPCKTQILCRRNVLPKMPLAAWNGHKKMAFLSSENTIIGYLSLELLCKCAGAVFGEHLFSPFFHQ